MGSYDVNKVNLELVGHYCSNFNSEKEHYSNIAFSTFTNSYLNNCSDSYVNNITNKLKEKYNQINNGYKNISNWWNSYNDGIVVVEKKLINDYGSIIINNGQFVDADEEALEFKDLDPWLISMNCSKEMRDYIKKALDYAVKNGDVEVISIIKNLYKVEKKIKQEVNPHFKFIIGSDIYSNHCSRDGISIGKYQVDMGVYETFFHEITHMLDNLFNCGGLTKNYGVNFYEKTTIYQRNAMADPNSRQKMQDFLEYSNDYYHDIFEKQENYLDRRREIADIFESEDTNNLTDEIYECLGMDKEKDELGIKGLDEVQVKQILFEQTEIYSFPEDLDEYIKTSEGQAMACVSDIISCMNHSTDPIDFNGKKVYFSWPGHGEIGSDNSTLVYREQLANFMALRCLGRQDYLDYLRDIYGDEWYNSLNQQIANIDSGLQSLSS